MPTEPSASATRARAQVEHALTSLAAAQSRFFGEIVGRVGAAPDYSALWRALAEAAARDPQRIYAIHARHLERQLALWRSFAAPGDGQPLPQPEADARFAAPEWSQVPWFDYLRRAYGLGARYLRELLGALELEPAARRKLEFAAEQYLAAAAPSNFAYTNPEALRLAYASGGESLARGLQNLLSDLAKGRVSMTDESAFEVGRDLAATPGAVVFRNELIELLQYRPTTPKVYARALVMIPPCINKYYLLDLRAENSFVRYAVANGLQVFMVSWRDVPAELGKLGWDDYVEQGVARALEVAREIAGGGDVNALGFCVGGTLLGTSLAVSHARGRRPAASLTLLASLLDFSDPGDIAVYIDQSYVQRCESEFAAGGVMPGSRLAAAFASLRPNELVWRYVVDNYLKGRSPSVFDLLYWNSDAANLAGPMYAYYLRHMYLENALCKPCALEMCGAPVDLRRVDLPAYVLATEADHIVPWRSAYASAHLLGGPVTFVLGGSGHIAGVVNPPDAKRRGYRAGALMPNPHEWLERARKASGSWWPHWLAWIRRRSGALARAPTGLGSASHPALDAAPGRYVREKAAA